MLLKIVCIVAVVYIGLGALLAVLQNWIIFPAGGQTDVTPKDAGWEYEDLYLPVGKHKTHAWFIPVENARGTVLFSHGNAGNMHDRLGFAEILRDLRVNIFFYDYGGYGLSTGPASERRCYADIRAAWSWLTGEKGIEAKEIALFGRSLGGGPTCELAREATPAGVILESAFTSIPDLGQETYPIFPVRWLVRHKMDNAEKAPDISAPLLVIHSPEDEIIPYHHGRKLFELAPEPKSFFRLQGTHNEGWYGTGLEYVGALDEFLSKCLEPSEIGASTERLEHGLEHGPSDEPAKQSDAGDHKEGLVGE